MNNMIHFHLGNIDVFKKSSIKTKNTWYSHSVNNHLQIHSSFQFRIDRDSFFSEILIRIKNTVINFSEYGLEFSSV